MVWIAYRATVVKVAEELVRRDSQDEPRAWTEILAEAETARAVLGRRDTQHMRQAPFEDPDWTAPGADAASVSSNHSQELWDPEDDKEDAPPVAPNTEFLWPEREPFC